ncbi:MAG: hypothetical protein R3297_07360 [Desulfobulbales bacterium]|nr:hypothetical protein [Desulfobulbales bacterium]
MAGKKADNAEIKEVQEEQRRLQCAICGNNIESGACNWQEDDDGVISCHYCSAVSNSCGCSD